MPHLCFVACLTLIGLATQSAQAEFKTSGSASVPAAKLSSATMPSWKLTGARGETIRDDQFLDAEITVIAFLGTECPLAKLYARTLNTIHDQYYDRGVRVIAAMSNRQDSLEEILAFVHRSELKFAIGKDLGNELADAVGAERTPEVFVFDANRRLRYRGRIDDQYGIGTILDTPRTHDLKNAIDALLAGNAVDVAKTDAVGCLIGRRKNTIETAAQDSSPLVTFHQDVAPILQNHCVTCHQAGEIGPFALQDYDEVAGWADMIVETVSQKRMPPWHAGDQSTVQFRNARAMSDQEIETLRSWADNGTPIGEPTSADQSQQSVVSQADPEPMWQRSRDPDYVFQITDDPVSVPATGEVKYQYYRVDPKFDRDVWVSAMQLRPGNRAVVHHILAFARDINSSERLHAERGYLDGYVPGYRVEPFQPGYAKRIPAGSELIFQLHYTPTGADETDLSQFALWEIDESKVTHEIHTNSALDVRLNIPPGEANYKTQATSPPIPEGAELLAMMPHMHVRGKSFRYELQPPQDAGVKSWLGRIVGNAPAPSPTRVLLDVPDYDFNWQTAYVLAEPMRLPAGGRLVCYATFDNSASNLSNPDPTKTVRWGDQTWDEMMIGYFHYALPR